LFKSQIANIFKMTQRLDYYAEALSKAVKPDYTPQRVVDPTLGKNYTKRPLHPDEEVNPKKQRQ
jgi:hypothetical protein